MSLPFMSLNAATTTGAGGSRDLEGVADHHTMVITKTGGGGVHVNLEGSHDGVNWVSLGAGGFGNPSADGSVINSVFADGHLVRHVRANLTDIYSGTSPTVTVTIASDIEVED
jgi:hypothetical protein